MIENSISIKLEDFDGPLAFLLQLVKREEMSIRDIHINQITIQYLQYLDQYKDVDFDMCGEYLYLAASLLYIKSVSCFAEDKTGPAIIDEWDKPLLSKEQLISRLENLEKFQKIAQQMHKFLPRVGEDVFVRPHLDKTQLANSFLLPISSQELINSYMNILERNKRKYTVVKRDRLSIKEKLIYLKELLKVGEEKLFSDLLQKTQDPNDIVITFISVLELARLKKVKLFQVENYAKIHINVVENLNDFDVETANGFEEELPAPEATNPLETAVNTNENIDLNSMEVKEVLQ
jgi:segregation and condensation protein A